ncbi:hypothetical protein AQUCO_01700466v1 [Aquilegia coerulea]|uniref:PHD-type domain-containing protein n=1 Tax=Aquilegia coerulea TaxID=218851 RepID=A0A2G5DN60_AQUCA|nr:hypothetical protein AQUCO_01700466v1 [Aquilegia coerulea]PIA44906.1 hypothetical protein AQUCO_01700466v1 [Aquilegia coerulea]
MKDDSRSGNIPERVEKVRGPFGCLIVKKKGDGMSNGGSAGNQKVFESKERKRPRLILSDSESDEDLYVSPPPKVVCHDGDASVSRNSITDSIEREKHIEIDRKRKQGPHIYREGTRIDRSKFVDIAIERKKNRIGDTGYCKEEKFDKILLKDGVEERRTEIGRNGVLISKTRVPIDKQRDFEAESSRSISLDNRDHSDFDSHNKVERDRELIYLERQRIEMKNGRKNPGFLREKFGAHHCELIRVQGKNGVLKVMPKSKNKVGGPDKLFSPKIEEKSINGFRSADYSNERAPIPPSLYSESKLREKSQSVVVTEKKQVSSHKKMSIKKSEINQQRTQVIETSLLQEPMDVGTCSSKKEVSNKKQRTLTSESCMSTKRKEGEVKRGSGTEKQLLREQIRQMLVNAGWTIDLRPRRNRDYQDAVYINPAGTEFWSITKAYYAFQKHFEDEGKDQNHRGDLSSFTPIPEDVISKLTRQTRKKIEREMRMKQKTVRGIKNANETSGKMLKNRHVKVITDSDMSEENMNSPDMQDDKLMKVRIKGKGVVDLNAEDIVTSKQSTLSKDGLGNVEDRKQNGRALLARRSSKGPNMDGDDFVPYTGKRTVLSWLIDMETIPLSGKVQYMNKKRTRAKMEGWITRDGIHCCCCSKILTISKFELHAGSKVHKPLKNIIVENGASLYQCQLDAWNKQDKSVRLGFQFIDIDGDDPNDDTCGICGDGGDLICCDGCPSTFHQSCLDIKMLPSGDWLCPNCSCKFCDGIDSGITQEDETTLCSCSLCEEKYHRFCVERADATPIDSDSLSTSFCGKACKELFQQLQKLLGVKHELEAGFSWTLIQRSNLDADPSIRGQCQKAEWNSKIAVALTVMDECFLPVTDQRSGVNLIHNVLYNIGSNFNRLNYSGFYTAVLERGDEIISAASIRIHGTRLAEMPFIGTRHIYRRQGMCRRLFGAIESALRSLNVEKMVIPAISELMHTWTTVFGFKPLEVSDRQEVKAMNILVFPRTDLLQKPLLKHRLTGPDKNERSVVKGIEPNGNNHVMPVMSENADIGSVEPDTSAPNKGAVCDHKINSEVSMEIGPIDCGGSSDAALGTLPASPNDCSAPGTKLFPHCGVDHDNSLGVGTKPNFNSTVEPDSSVEPELQCSAEDDSHEVNADAATTELDFCPLDETSGQHTTSTKIITDRTPLQLDSSWIEHNDHKVKGDVDMSSNAPDFSALEHSTVNNCEMNNSVDCIGTGLKGPDGSTYDTSDILRKRLDDGLGFISDGPCHKSAPDTKFSLDHVVDCDTEFDVEIKPIVGSDLELKPQNITDDDAHEVKVKIVGAEHDVPLSATSPQLTTTTKRNNPTAVSGSCRTGENNVQSNSDLDERCVHKVECDLSDVVLRPIPDALSEKSATGPKFLLRCTNHDTKLDMEKKSSELKLQKCTEADVLELHVVERNSDVDKNNIHDIGLHFKPNVLLTSVESVEQDVNEAKTEISSSALDIYPSDECCGQNQLQVAALGNCFEGSSENIVCSSQILRQ